MNISQIISSRNSWGSIYTVGPEKEPRIEFDKLGLSWAKLSQSWGCSKKTLSFG